MRQILMNKNVVFQNFLMCPSDNPLGDQKTLNEKNNLLY